MILNDNFNTSENQMSLEIVLKNRFGLSEFRNGQKEVIQNLLSGKSVLVTMPTGSGKSLCYQLPALIVEGITIVVSPLIALMKDQVDELIRLKIPATFINSMLTIEESNVRFKKVANGEISLLYVAPERFYSAGFVELIKSISISLFIVDEAHCISQWGHDFRPSYLRLKNVIGMLGNPPVGAFTATATPDVREDIKLQLKLKSPVEITTGFDRPNLKYFALTLKNDEQKENELLRILPTIPGTGIIYAGTKKLVNHLTNLLNFEGFSAKGYHGGMEKDERNETQNEWVSGKVDIIVATNAFGMGIDKANVRFVIHYTMPGTIEAYYQESGRAGRNGKVAYCIAFSSYSDIRLQEFFINNAHPPKDVIIEIYQFLHSINQQDIFLTQKEIADRVSSKIKDMMIGSSLVILERAGLLERLNRSEHNMTIELLPESENTDKLRKDSIQDKLLKTIRQLSQFSELQIPPEFLVEKTGLTRQQLGAALMALESKELIQYVAPFRGRGVRMKGDQIPEADLPIDFDEIGRHSDYQQLQLQKMETYFYTSKCRRRYILDYFGERYKYQNCKGCDVCLNWHPPDSDSKSFQTNANMRIAKRHAISNAEQELPKLILQLVLEVNDRYGRDSLAKTLAGSKSTKLPNYLATGSWYGKASQITKKYITHTFNELIEQDYLRKSGGLYPTLSISQSGKIKLQENLTESIQIKERDYSGRKLSNNTEFTETLQATWFYYQKEMSLEEMASVRGVTLDTITNHLGRLTELGKNINIERFISREKIDRILSTIRKFGCKSFRELKDNLNLDSPEKEFYTYPDIRLVVTCCPEAREAANKWAESQIL